MSIARSRSAGILWPSSAVSARARSLLWITLPDASTTTIDTAAAWTTPSKPTPAISSALNAHITQPLGTHPCGLHQRRLHRRARARSRDVKNGRSSPRIVGERLGSFAPEHAADMRGSYE